ncbi:MAG: flagellar motor protein MotB [Pseudomonadota bacterium]
MATYSSARSGRGRSLRRGESRRPGQWKLAYADFLTALMAFFLLMWLSTEQTAENRQGIAAYFNGQTSAVAVGASSGAQFTSLKDDIASDTALTAYADRILVTETTNGLRIELTDANALPLFDNGGSDLSDSGSSIIESVAKTLSGRPFLITVEGHTDAFPASGQGFTNWELSTARANAARVILEQSGINADRIRAVTGLADTIPLLPNQPHASVNRRISIVLELHG